MGHAEAKTSNLKKMRRLLISRRWTVKELVDEMGVSRQTIHNYLKKDIPEVEQDEQKRYWIDRRRYVSNIQLSLDEALVLYLAARKLQRQTWFQREAVAGALTELAQALQKPMVQRMIGAANEVRTLEQMPAEREQVMTAVVKAWANNLVLNLRYRPPKSNRPYEDRLRVYLIEPAPWGDAIYAIGHSEKINPKDKLDEVVMYKIARIERASCSGETFEIPENFDEGKILKSAWGIWRGKGEPKRVRLRFEAGAATRRVRESVWHQSAERLDLPTGGCELTVEVSEVTEMVPWIRSWGPQVEVLEPAWLRDQMLGEARRLGEIYGSGASQVTLVDVFDDFFGG